MDSSVDVFVEPLSLLSSDLAQIAARIQSLENAHSARMEAAASRLEEALREKITASLQQRLDCEFQEGTRVIRSEFDERMRLATDQWTTERQSLMKEIASLRLSADRRELSTEIAQTETTLIELRNRIEAMVDDPTVLASKLLRATAREAELNAYLKGLRFKAGVSTGPLTDVSNAMQAEDAVILKSAIA
jgi:soluble cytochrome b562